VEEKKVLQWFAGRVEEARDEHGFTLIELLVVVTLLFRKRYRSLWPRPSLELAPIGSSKFA
jgi:hypothetical protein